MGGRAQGTPARRDGAARLRPAPPACGTEVQRPAQAARPAESPVSLGGRLSHVRVERGRKPVGRRTPPVFFLVPLEQDRKSTRLNSSHVAISYAVFCLIRKRCTLTYAPGMRM